MQLITNNITNWMLDFLDMLLKNTFEHMDNSLIGITDIVRLSPSEWEGGLPWQMTETVARVVMTPIAAIIITYVMSMEIISVIQDKNNFRDIDVSVIYKIIFRMTIAVILVNSSLKLVAAMYQMGAYMISKSSSVIGDFVAEPMLGADAIIEQLRNNPDVGVGELANMIVYVLPCFLIALAIKIIAYLTVYGRLIEIVIYSSICPIPMATLMNKDWSDIGKNYIKSMFALGVQGFLIVFIFGIYAIMLRNVSLDYTSMKTLEQGLLMRCIIGVVLCGCLFKAGTISKSILNAH